jgi:hypothetical protein
MQSVCKGTASLYGQVTDKNVSAPESITLPKLPYGTVLTNPGDWLEFANIIQNIAKYKLGISESENKTEARKRSRMYLIFGCKCGDFSPVEATGYSGRKNTACYHCCERCPRCHNPSTHIDYSMLKWGTSMVCHGCAIGDNEEAESARGTDDEDYDEDEDEDEGESESEE